MNHRDHLALTFAFLREAGFARGSDAVFEHLRNLDAAHHEGRFHATLSTVWPRLVAAHMRRDDEDFQKFFAREAALADKGLPLHFYTHERLSSEAARRRFVEPDLRDLPRIQLSPLWM